MTNIQITKFERQTGIEPAPKTGYPQSRPEISRATFTLLPQFAGVTRLELVLRGWKPQSGTESRCAKPLHYTPKLFIDKSI